MEKSGYPTQDVGNASMHMPMPGGQYPPIPGQIQHGGYNPHYAHQEPPPNYETAQGHELNKNLPYPPPQQDTQHPVIVTHQPVYHGNVRSRRIKFFQATFFYKQRFLVF